MRVLLVATSNDELQRTSGGFGAPFRGSARDIIERRLQLIAGFDEPRGGEA